MADRQPTEAQVARAMARNAERMAAVRRGARPMPICLHEAAHAVVAHELGDKVLRLEIGGAAGAGGATHQLAGGYRPDPLREGMIAIAGHAAEVLWCRQPVWAAPVDDDRWLRAMGFRGTSIPTLLALAQGQCIVHEPKIRAVAAALKKGDLDRRGFLRALRSAGRSAPRGCDALATASLLVEDGRQALGFSRRGGR